MDFPSSNLPDVPSFDPNDLNKSPGEVLGTSPNIPAAGAIGQTPNNLNKIPGEVPGTSGTRPAIEVIEQEQTSRRDTDTDSPASIELNGEGTVSLQKIDLPELSEDLRREIPGYIMYVNDKDSTLKLFRTFNELTEYVVDATSFGARWKEEFDVAVSDIVNTPLKRISHQSTLGKYLRYLYMSDLLTDVRIHVAEASFMAHRVVLCLHSDYLAELFFRSKRTKIPFDLRINGICAEAFEAFLEFIYTGELTVGSTAAADLLLLADFLSAKGLQRKRELIAKNLPLDTVVKIVAQSRDNIPEHVLVGLLQMITANFSAATQMRFFFEIDVDTLCSLLARDDLVVSSEFEVWKCAVDWIYYDLRQRKRHTDRLLSHVRFCHMSQEELFMCVEKNSLFRETDRYKGVLANANWIITSRLLGRPEPFGFSTPPPRKCLQGLARKPAFKVPVKFNIPVSEPAPATPTVSLPPPLRTSTPVTSPPKPSPKPRPKPVGKPILIPNEMQRMTSPIPKSVDILVVGAFQLDSDKLNEPQGGAKDKWDHYCQLPEPKQNHAVTLLSGKLYLIGGCNPGDNPTPTKQVFAMDMDGKRWQRVAEMIEARSSHSACAMNGRIYAIGGKGINNRILASVECYNPATDVWSYVSSLTMPRFAASATCLDGMIYVVGGLGETKGGMYNVPILSDVEMYEQAVNIWTSKSKLRFPRCNAALVNSGGRLYLCGGMTHAPDSKGGRVLVSVAAIDEYVAKRDTWCHSADLAIPRHDAGVAVAGPRIYIIGGVSTTTDKVLQSVECYDTCACAWLSGMKELPVPSRHIRCVSMVSEWRR